MSDPSDEDVLLHELRNRINLLGFALHAYRRDADPSHLESMELACESAIALLAQLDVMRRGDEGRG